MLVTLLCVQSSAGSVLALPPVVRGAKSPSCCEDL